MSKKMCVSLLLGALLMGGEANMLQGLSFDCQCYKLESGGEIVKATWSDGKLAILNISSTGAINPKPSKAPGQACSEQDSSWFAMPDQKPYGPWVTVANQRDIWPVYCSKH